MRLTTVKRLPWCSSKQAIIAFGRGMADILESGRLHQIDARKALHQKLQTLPFDGRVYRGHRVVQNPRPPQSRECIFSNALRGLV